ncbi:uncharacterized protein LOC125939911 [Dermacentor silvarum]|uniref:uncharacterized protein LOC125939911 n=1 Tax=Dermacentor silvarum TaxID=543639 RepID=UPI002100BEE7|nr:uncharacterized protein LOC125939911 [Dermacentor silvarum]
MDVYYLFVSYQMDKHDQAAVVSMDSTGVASTNGTLCTDQPSAAVVRHYFQKTDFYWRTAKALAYICGAQPISYFTSLTPKNFTAVKDKLSRCLGMRAEENHQPGHSHHAAAKQRSCKMEFLLYRHANSRGSEPSLLENMRSLVLLWVQLGDTVADDFNTDQWRQITLQSINNIADAHLRL